MTPSELHERLRDAPVPGEEDARERAWRVVAAAYPARPPSPRRSRRFARALAAAAAAVVGLGLALTPPGEAVGRWVRSIVRSSPPAQVRSVLGPLPGHGRLLVTTRGGAWILQPDGTRRRLGAYDGATFSPHGLYVAVTRANLLAAVDLVGHVHWTLSRPAAVTRPAWSPDGFRVAYRSGRELRVVYGDGALDHVVAPASAPVTPAWLPGAGHRLAYVAPGGRTVLARDADTGALLWRAAAPGRVTQLAPAPSGSRLLAVTAGRVRVLDAGGGVGRTLRAPAGTRLRRAAWLADGGFALLRTAAAGERSEVVLAGAAGRPRVLLAVPGRLTDMLASPDGRWLLLAAPDAGQWLLVRTSGPGRLTALSRVGRQFDPGGRGPAPLPRLAGWIG